MARLFGMMWLASPTQQPAATVAQAGRIGDHITATRQHGLAASYDALHQAYLARETVFAATMADRADWDNATRAQRRLAVAADAELRRRYPDQHFSPLPRLNPTPPPKPSWPSSP